MENFVNVGHFDGISGTYNINKHEQHDNKHETNDDDTFSCGISGHYMMDDNVISRYMKVQHI